MSSIKTKKRENIVQRGDKFYVHIMINGKRKWFSAGNSIRNARRILADRTSERENKTYVEIKKIKFKDFADLWIDSYVKTIAKPSTLRSYKNIIASLKDEFGSYDLENITTADLQKYVAKRLKKKKRKSEETIKPKTVCNEIVVIKRMFKHAIRWSYLKNSPAEYIEKPRVEKEEMKILNPEEVRLFLDEVTPKHKPFFLMAVLTGMRLGELLGLQWGDINWNNRQIHVRQQLCNTSKKFITPKSRYAVRRIDMSATLVMELKKHKLACLVSEHDLVFCNATGNPLDPDNLRKRHFEPALRRAKVNQVRIHDLRHTNASMRFEQGQNPIYVSRQLGHASVKTTLDIYGHLIKDVNWEQADKLDSILGFAEHSGSLSEGCRESVDMEGFNEKKDSELSPKSLILNGSGGRI